MTFMEWEQRFELGVAAMDAEHKGLIAAMNHVHDLDAANAAKSTIDAAIGKLAELTTKHFADEEKHMESIGFPDRRTHARIHENLLERFAGLHTSFRAGSGKVDRAFFDFLSFWLRSHILGVDRNYASHGKPAGVR
ncbi:MAG: hemerythrin family protein [Planctomycetes bacterium]|nr:hemerythrin family protein [Planctomycetota bacterium]